jgi:ankyrin repeat protein
VTRITRPTRNLPAQPDIDHLRRQAKELLEAFLSGSREAAAEVDTHYRDADPKSFALHDAQLVIARAYGFDSWPKLKTHVDGLTAKQFIDAARENNLDKAAALLKARPDLIDMQWSYGDERRALHYAVMNNAAVMVQLLMQHGASADLGVHPHRDATTPRTMAVERGLSEIVAIIDREERARREKAGQGGTVVDSEQELARRQPSTRTEAAIRTAIARGDTDWLRKRHAERPIVNMPDWGSGGLLTLAASSDQPAVLALLLDFGFDPDERVRWSEGPDAAYSQGYPLWHCAATGKKEMAELLLQRGASPNVHVDSSGSPVYAAFKHRRQEMVELLRRYGGIVAPDIVGLYRETNLAKELLAGATDAPFPEGLVPPGRSIEDYLLEFALSGGAAEIVGMVLDRISWPRDDPRWFRMLGRGLDFWNHIPWLQGTRLDFDRGSYIEGYRMLVDRCDPNVVGGFGRTALHEVAAAGDHVTDSEASALAGLLLNAGARIGLRDELLNSTALGWACRWGRAGVVRMMLEHGADSLERDAEPWATPRAWAEKTNHSAVLAVLDDYDR